MDGTHCLQSLDRMPMTPAKRSPLVRQARGLVSLTSLLPIPAPSSNEEIANQLLRMKCLKQMRLCQLKPVVRLRGHEVLWVTIGAVVPMVAADPAQCVRVCRRVASPGFNEPRALAVRATLIWHSGRTMAIELQADASECVVLLLPFFCSACPWW